MRDVNHFVEFSSGKHIDRAVVLDYKTGLENRYAISSANSMIASLNSFFRFMGWQDLCVKQFKVQKQTFCKEEKELTKEEYIRLVRTAEQKHDERLCLILQTICGTGIRVSELQYITAEAVRKGEAIVSCKNKIRTVFIVRELQKNCCIMRRSRILLPAVFLSQRPESL